jgi:hypothetical protein
LWAARASAPSIACSARPSSIGGWTHFELDRTHERFDLVYCFGILHRVENPLGLLRVLRGRTASVGTILVETYGVCQPDRDEPAIRVSAPGEVYARDEFVYWGSGNIALHRLARIAGFSRDRAVHRGGGRRSPAHHGRLIA